LNGLKLCAFVDIGNAEEVIVPVIHPFPNICRFYFFIPTFNIRLIKKYILKLYYIINYIIVKIHNNYKFYFK
jgi:hypothetical protein